MNIRKGDWVVEKPHWYTRTRPRVQGRVIRFVLIIFAERRWWSAVVRSGKRDEVIPADQLRVTRRKV